MDDSKHRSWLTKLVNKCTVGTYLRTMDYIPKYQEYVIKYELQKVWYQWIQQTSPHLNDFLQILKVFY